MKKTSRLLVFAVITLFFACRKEEKIDSGTTSNSTSKSMNATEKKIVGAWFIKKERDSMFTTSSVFQRDTTFTGYDITNYVKFGESKVGTDYWQCDDAVGLINNQVVPPSLLQNNNAVGSFWYYEEATGYVVVSTVQYRLVSLTSAEMILHSKIGGRNKYYYFSK